MRFPVFLQVTWNAVRCCCSDWFSYLRHMPSVGMRQQVFWTDFLLWNEYMKTAMKPHSNLNRFFPSSEAKEHWLQVSWGWIHWSCRILLRNPWVKTCVLRFPGWNLTSTGLCEQRFFVGSVVVNSENMHQHSSVAQTLVTFALAFTTTCQHDLDADKRPCFSSHQDYRGSRSIVSVYWSSFASFAAVLALYSRLLQVRLYSWCLYRHLYNRRQDISAQNVRGSEGDTLVLWTLCWGWWWVLSLFLFCVCVRVCLCVHVTSAVSGWMTVCLVCLCASLPVCLCPPVCTMYQGFLDSLSQNIQQELLFLFHRNIAFTFDFLLGG